MLAAVSGLSGQTGMISSGTEMITFMNSDLNYINNQKERYAKIEGSAYLDEAFIEGSISFNRKKYMGLKLRHNAYEGYFEFQTDEGIKFFDPSLTPVDTVWLDKEVFIFVPYRSGKTLKKDYMRLVNRGSTRVLIFSQVFLIQSEPAKGYEEARPARFEKRGDIIFIQAGNRPAMEFRGKKSLEEIFPEHHEALVDHAKEEKLKLKKVGEIVSLCAYYDSIR